MINESKPAGILRIKQGETDFDDNYFFDVSAAVGGNHNVTLTSLGNGKALTKVFRKDLVSQYSDFNGAYVIEYYVLDLINQSATKLDIPLARWVYTETLNIGNNEYVIGANTQDGNFFYIYNASTESVTKGAQYIGGDINFLESF
jgi:hypothetical protein